MVLPSRVGNGVSVPRSAWLMVLGSKVHCWYCNTLVCLRWHVNVSLMEARDVLLKDICENSKDNFYFSCSWGGWPRKGKTQRVTHIYTQAQFYMLWGWWSCTETGNRKFAQVKCNSKARLACTKKMHYNWKDYFQISKPWRFTLVFFKNNNKKKLASKYKCIPIVASSGYCVYRALVPNTAACVGPTRDLQGQLFAFLSKIDFPVISCPYFFS